MKVEGDTVMNRYGLLIANFDFPQAPSLPKLSTPQNDVAALKSVLQDRSKGNFELETANNCNCQQIKVKIDSLFRRTAESDGLALIYYSGHGLLDPTGSLYLATSETTEENTFVLSVSVRDILTYVRHRGPRRVIILLDCCYSGAAGTLYEPKGAAAVVPSLSEGLKGTGVVIMTATSAVEPALGDKRSGYGIFTNHVVQGLNTACEKKIRGRDPDQGIPVTVNDMFNYVKVKMEEENAPQTPHIWNLESTGDFTFAEVFLLGTKDKPLIQQQARWTILRDEKRTIFDLSGPSYILDRAYHFLDWNTAFELLIARPLRLQRGTHVVTFLNKLRNWSEVFDRSNKVFLPGQDPMVDTEVLQYQSENYGLITFQKIASQIPNVRGGSKAWSVHLNISEVERNRNELWDDMANELRKYSVWSKYAESYDEVISPFTKYRELSDLVVSKIGNAARCADLGAGTGNVTIRLLSEHNARTVLAVEKNEAMLECLQRKLENYPTSVRKRALLYKGDIMTALGEQRSESLDACIMLNVLFALQNPAEVLTEVFRVLRHGAVLALSTSHKTTNIRFLFNSIKNDLTQQGIFSQDLEPIWLEAFYRNMELETMICRDSKEQIHDYIVKAGFAIEEYHENEYVNCVVVYKAIKP
jgi:ubiquinone/menaquinone biosynthesis C-methylase UbiE